MQSAVASGKLETAAGGAGHHQAMIVHGIYSTVTPTSAGASTAAAAIWNSTCSDDCNSSASAIVPMLSGISPALFTRQLLFINTKNCSLSIVLTATDQKPQKSLKR